jgi:ribosome biogenesis protein SSF1/2
VAKKKDVKDAKKQRRLERKQQREDGQTPGGDKDDDSELDDAEYYRQEVGEEPDTYMFPDAKKQKLAAKVQSSGPPKELQKPGQKAPSDKARRFLKAAVPKGKVVRQRQPKK